MCADRRFLWLWLSVATSLSVAGNVGHAWVTVGGGATRLMAIGWAVAPPALLMLAIHGLPTLARMLDSDERDKLLTVVVWGVTAGAFGWSAFGIFGFSNAMGLPGEIAWVAPLVIDLSVFGATRGLVLTAPVAARMNAGIAPTHFSSDTDAVTVQQTPAAALPIVDSPLAQPPRTPVPRQLPEAAADMDPAPPPDFAGEPASSPAGVAPETLTLAQQIVASGKVRKPVETVAAILSAAAGGETRKKVIADHSGVHHSVVTKALDAAEWHRRQHIAAVG
jgi:hypothetical protein